MFVPDNSGHQPGSFRGNANPGFWQSLTQLQPARCRPDATARHPEDQEAEVWVSVRNPSRGHHWPRRLSGRSLGLAYASDPFWGLGSGHNLALTATYKKELKKHI